MHNRIHEIIRQAADSLKHISQECALREAELILEDILALPRSQLYTETNLTVDEEQRGRIRLSIERRLSGMPLAYILGHSFFYEREFQVSSAVLIPRPETEILIDTVLSLETGRDRAFLDLGTGSGIIAQILSSHHDSWKSFAADLSLDALDIARRNCSPSVMLFCCDTVSAVKELPFFDFIVSNPPYISENEYASLEKSVIDFEPRLALYGGKDGLDFYRYLAGSAHRYLKSKGRFYCEIGYNQKESVTRLFGSAGWTDISVVNDLAQRPRVLTARWE